MSRTILLALLVILLMPLSGCIVWYVGHPEVTVTTQSFATNETSLPFYLQIPRAPCTSTIPRIITRHSSTQWHK